MLKINDIKVGTRFRQDLGDLDALSASIAEVGLLHPVVLSPNFTLVAGKRRLEACRALGWKEIPVCVIADLSDAVLQLKAERDENTCRLDMKPSEKVALGRELEAFEKPKAHQRKREGWKKRGQNLDINNDKVRTPRTSDVVGEALGMAGATYMRAKAVVDRAAAGRPDAKEALAVMDETGVVSRAYGMLTDVTPRKSRALPRDLTKINGQRVGSRTVKQAVASLRQAAQNVDAAAAGFDMEAFGDLSLLIQYPAADEWFDLLLDGIQRLGGHARTVKRYRQAAREAG